MADLIVVDPEVMLGKPVEAGTRITVEHILEQLGHGDSILVFTKRLLALDAAALTAPNPDAPTALNASPASN
jgi:uncharacterized protein (DUF433 family)